MFQRGVVVGLDDSLAIFFSFQDACMVNLRL